MSLMKLGFLVAKDTDPLQDPPTPDGRPSYVGDLAYLEDLPQKYRVNVAAGEHKGQYFAMIPKDQWEGCTAQVFVDVGFAWYMKKKFPDIRVDIIMPHEITEERLRGNDANFLLGYDLINAWFDGEYEEKLQVFKACDNIWPTYEFQEGVYLKTRYLQGCLEHKVPLAPTHLAWRGDIDPKALFEKVRASGWQDFIAKKSFSAFSDSLQKFSTEECEADLKDFEAYFEDPNCPEFILQEAMSGFAKHWETRCFWWEGTFLYAIANQSAYATGGGEVIIGHEELAERYPDFLAAAKAIGEQALKSLPEMRTADGRPVKQMLVRTDIGCNSGEIHDRHAAWDPAVKTWFLNEIEYTPTTWFLRILREDKMPMFAELFYKKAVEILGGAPAPEAAVKRPPAAEAGARSSAAAMKRPAAEAGARSSAAAMKKPAAAAVRARPSAAVVTQKPAAAGAVLKRPAVARKPAAGEPKRARRGVDT